MRGFEDPPPSARLRCYWWWLNRSCTTEQTITRDSNGNEGKRLWRCRCLSTRMAPSKMATLTSPAGPEFGRPRVDKTLSPRAGCCEPARPRSHAEHHQRMEPWRPLGQAGTGLEAAHMVTHGRRSRGAERVSAAGRATGEEFFLSADRYACLSPSPGRFTSGRRKDRNRKPLSDLPAKSAAREMGFSMPDATSLAHRSGCTPVDADASLNEIVDITTTVSANGQTSWTPPAGSHDSWEILRIGYTSSDARVSTSSGEWQGLAIDYLDTAALDLYWKTERTSADHRRRAACLSKTLKYVASAIAGSSAATNWTSKFRARISSTPPATIPVTVSC